MYGHQGSVTPSRPKTFQHCHSARHRPHRRLLDARLRIRREGPEAVHGRKEQFAGLRKRHAFSISTA